MIELNKIYNEDCLIGMLNIPDKSIDMILTDLPYGTTSLEWDNIIPFEPMWEQYKRIIKDDGAIVLTASQPFTSKLVMSNLEMFKYEWIWEKQKASNFLNAKHVPLKYHENVLVFAKGKTKYNPQKYPVLELSEIMTNIEKKGKKYLKDLITSKDVDRFGVIDRRKNVNAPTKNKGVLGISIIKNRTVDTGFRFPKSVLKINKSLNKNTHPTQKPEALFEYFIRTYTDEGDTVLDTCMGSGTTAIAAIETGRNFIGFETDTKYHDESTQRIAAKQLEIEKRQSEILK